MKRILIIIFIFGFAFAQSDTDAHGERIFTGSSFTEEETESESKSALAAVGLSILLPGAGEMYIGVRNAGLPLMIADGLILGSATAFAYGANWRTNEYKEFAAKHAGVHIEGKDSDFFKSVALYPNRDTYNYYRLLSERDESQLYPETDEWDWRWQSDNDQLKYYDIRTASEKNLRNFKIALGVAGINRLISVINVLRLVRGGAGWDFAAAAYPDGNMGIGVAISVSGELDLLNCKESK